MSKNPAKDFGQIADDYAFFEAQSTEGPRDAAAFVRQLSGMADGRPEIRMLDFGCGTGSFTSHLLELLRWPPERLKLTLVEPVESARAKAVTRLAAFTTSEIVDSPALPADRAGQFDVVLSNHVLYYVPDLPARLAELIAAVAPGGLFTMALSGLSNTLIGIWTRAFEILGREMPYNVADDAEVALAQLGVNFEKEEVPYELIFEDTAENRMKILRFLLADHLEQLPQQPLWDVLDKYRKDGRIEMFTASEHFTVRKP